MLISFYCEKLNDTETIIPALKGLVTLTALSSFTSEEASTVIEAYVYRTSGSHRTLTVHRLFKYVKMKALVQAIRFNVFTIIDTLMAKHRASMSPECALVFLLTSDSAERHEQGVSGRIHIFSRRGERPA